MLITRAKVSADTLIHMHKSTSGPGSGRFSLYIFVVYNENIPKDMLYHKNCQNIKTAKTLFFYKRGMYKTKKGPCQEGPGLEHTSWQPFLIFVNRFHIKINIF